MCGSIELARARVQAKDTLEAVVTEHFRLSGVYWGLTALYLIGRLDIMDGQAIVEWVRSVRQFLRLACWPTLKHQAMLKSTRLPV